MGQAFHAAQGAERRVRSCNQTPSVPARVSDTLSPHACPVTLLPFAVHDEVPQPLREGYALRLAAGLRPGHQALAAPAPSCVKLHADADHQGELCLWGFELPAYKRSGVGSCIVHAQE
jgi:hypothetical protein